MMRCVAILMIVAAVVCHPVVSDAFTWEFKDDAGGWRAGNAATAFPGGGSSENLWVEDGVLYVEVKQPSLGSTPLARLVSPELYWDTGLFDRVIVRVRASSGDATITWGMNWLTPDTPDSRTAPVNGPYTTNSLVIGAVRFYIWSDTWSDLQIDELPSMEGWEGELRRIGLEFIFWQPGGGYIAEGSFPEEILIESITLTGPGEEIWGSPELPGQETGFGTLFEEYSSYGIGYAPFAISGADFDGDGDTDLMAAALVSLNSDATEYEGKLILLLNDGEGTFSDQKTYALDRGIVPSFLWAGDVTGEGNPDLVIGNASGDEIVVLVGLGGGRFS